MFPRGPDGAASQQDEDDFLLEHFDRWTFYSLGARFLKQALYAVAVYNESRVLEFAAAWAKHNSDRLADPGILTSACAPPGEVRLFFTTEQLESYEESFLLRAIMVIRYGVQHPHAEQVASTTPERGASATTEMRDSPPAFNTVPNDVTGSDTSPSMNSSTVGIVPVACDSEEFPPSMFLSTLP